MWDSFSNEHLSGYLKRDETEKLKNIHRKYKKYLEKKENLRTNNFKSPSRAKGLQSIKGGETKLSTHFGRNSYPHKLLN